MRPFLSQIRAILYAYPYLTSLGAGSFASLSLPPTYVMPAFLAMGWVIYQAATARHVKQALIHVGLGAYGWFLASLYWISHSLLVGTADYWALFPISFFGIPIIVSLFWMAGALAGYLCARTSVGRAVMMVAMIGLSEWGREFIATGFPWNAPGLIMLGTEPTASLAAYFGQTGLTFITLFAAAIAPIALLCNTLKAGVRLRRYLARFVVLTIFGLGLLAFEHRQIMPLTAPDDETMIRVVQPVVVQADKWVPEKRSTHLARLASLSIVPAKRPLDLVIWPETAFAGNYHAEADILDKLAEGIANHHQKEGGAGQLLTGVVRFDAQSRLYNSALLLAEDGSKSLYDKTHLVPFGEYVPWRFIPFIDAIAGPIDFSKGDEVRPLFVPHFGLVLPLICYEVIFPALVGRATERPAMIVNLTNDGWFGHTAGPHQHLAQTQMTAISYGIAVMRVANTGISAAFDGKGARLASQGLGKVGYFDIAKPAIFSPTIFARYSSLIALLFFLICFVLAIGLDRLPQKRQ